jgi:dCMP deaminase
MNKWTDAYMDTAERFSQLSSCEKLKVGSIIVKDDRIISIGYNGTPAGWDNCCEDETGKTYDEVIHAEANAIAKLAKHNESGNDSSMYCTHSPCIHCAKQIYTAGIKEVYYKNNYRNDDGITFLEKCGVLVTKYG